HNYLFNSNKIRVEDVEHYEEKIDLSVLSTEELNQWHDQITKMWGSDPDNKDLQDEFNRIISFKNNGCRK
ncbi:MAG: hypothetical protein DRO67_02685, partial [Candidatus Asgardarchaeum californiense]